MFWDELLLLQVEFKNLHRQDGGGTTSCIAAGRGVNAKCRGDASPIYFVPLRGTMGFRAQIVEAEFSQVREPVRSELVAPRSRGASELVRPTPMALVSTPRQLAAAQPEADERDSQAALGSGVLVFEQAPCLG